MIKQRSAHIAKLLSESLMPQQKGQGQNRHGDSTYCKSLLAAAESQWWWTYTCALSLYWAFGGTGGGEWRTL